MKTFLLLIVLGTAQTLLCMTPDDPDTHSTPNRVLRVGVAGSQPFVVRKASSLEGISIEIWQALAEKTGWRYKFETYGSVPIALNALASGSLDIVVGPVSITADRAKFVRFSQPYFESNLSILSRTEDLSPWERIKPFFNVSFYYAVGFLLLVLAIVGTLVWLAERGAPDSQFPNQPVKGIASGIWFAVVTMSTVGYGDLAPKTHVGRAVAGIWIILSVITASSLVAGIASTLTLTGLKTSVISTAQDLAGKRVAVLANSPAESFVQSHGARIREVGSLQSGYQLLMQQAVDSVMFDRPQLLYYLQQEHNTALAVSAAEYMPQNYGFAASIDSNLVHMMNVNMLELEESGRVARIVREWLGESKE